MSRNKNVYTYFQRLEDSVIPFLLVLLEVCLISNAAIGQNMAAQSAPGKNFVQPVPKRFVSDLKALSLRWKVAFVAEGQPLTSHPDSKPLSLPAALTQEEAVKTLAEYYDYNAARQGRVYVLTKLYTDPKDVPDVTLEECRLALKAVSQMFAPFNPNFPPGDQFSSPRAHIAHLMTQQQLETMSQHGLPVTSLSAAQREEAWRIALNFYIQDQAQSVEDAAGLLGQITRQNALFHWQDIANVNAFGYDIISGDMPKVVFIPLSHSNRVGVSTDGSIVTLSAPNRIKNGEPVADVDPTEPDMKLTQQVLSATPAVAVTLAQVVADMNARIGVVERCKVDASLAAKRVTVVGQEDIAPSKVMNALTLVYGLRLIHREDGILLLTRPRDPYARDVADLGRAARNAIPAPLIRALHARIKEKKSSEQQSFDSQVSSPAPPLRQGEYQSAATTIRLAAIQEFRARAELKVKAGKNNSLPLSKLGEREHKLFAVYQAINALADTCWLGDRTPPPYIADFDHVLLTGGLYHNEQGNIRFSLFLSYPDPKTGEIRRGVGFANARLSQ